MLPKGSKDILYVIEYQSADCVLMGYNISPNLICEGQYCSPSSPSMLTVQFDLMCTLDSMDTSEPEVNVMTVEIRPEVKYESYPV